LTKYAAKLRLLERGLLDAAQGVDDLVIRAGGVVQDNSRPDQAGPSQKKSEADETPEQFMLRINLYVAVHLNRASDSQRDNYKDALVYQARKDVINEFLKTALIPKCLNCDRFAF
jgi:hypothetical protein